MERILSDDERMRRAEEIYYRRNNKNINILEKGVEKTNTHIKSKIILQLLLLLNMAIIIFAVQNKEYIFTEQFLSKCSEYNININEKFSNALKAFLVEDKETENKQGNDDEKSNEESKDSSNAINLLEDNTNETTVSKEDNLSELEIKQEISTLTQMNMDVENLKAAYSFVKPIEGVVSSGFGARESEYQNVTGYHTGIDIAAEKGTQIKASMEGIVTLVSSKGDYGNHVKIRCNNVTTLYAHCSKVLVSEGQIVAQGQDIAEVGSTGNSTGNHLHFEIRVDDRFINPSELIMF